MHGAFATGLREAAAIMAAFAAQRGEELRPALMTGKEMREAADPGSVAAGQQLVQLASLLQQVIVWHTCVVIMVFVLATKGAVAEQGRGCVFCSAVSCITHPCGRPDPAAWLPGSSWSHWLACCSR